MQIKIREQHTEKDKVEELRGMLSEQHIMTLRKLMQLHMVRSNLIFGGRYDKTESQRTKGIIGGKRAWYAASKEIKAAFRALEIIVATKMGEVGGSLIDPFSAEWLADILVIASDAANDASKCILDKYPLVTVFHFIAAAHRRNGGITRRPMDNGSVKQALKEVRNGR